MNKQIVFDSKRVTKGDVNDLIFDNYGNEYIFLKSDNPIMIFKKVSDDICYYFDKNGLMLNNTDIFLHIEHKTDIKKYKYLTCNLSGKENKIFYLKISDNCYFGFRTDTLYADYEFVKDAEYYFENCHEPDYDEKKVMFNRLYELGYGYNWEKQELFSNIQMIHKGKHYVFNNAVFKASHDITYDYRKDNLSIPYEYLIYLGSKKQGGMYENSTLGLPKYTCIREANENEIGEAKEIYERMKLTFRNVERKIIDIKFELEQTLRMLDRLKKENGQQG